MPSPRDIVLMVLVLLMELLPGFSLLAGTGLLQHISLQDTLFWLLLGAGCGGIGAMLVVAVTHPPQVWGRAGLVAGGLVLVAAPAWLSSKGSSFVTTMLLLAIAYWRGIVVADEVPAYEDVYRRFGLGFAVLFLGIILVVARGTIFQRPVWQTLALTGVAYTVVALAALATARMERSREPGAGRAVFLAVSFQLGFLLVLSLAALEFFSLDVGGWLGHLTQPLWEALGNLILTVLGVLLAPFFGLAELIRSHIQSPRVKGHLPVTPRPPTSRQSRPDHGGNSFLTILEPIAVLVASAAVAVFIWRMLPRLQRREPQEKSDEEEPNPWSAAAFWQGLTAWLRMLFHRGGDTVRSAVHATRNRVLGRPYPADPVRRLYVQMLRRAEARGVTRPISTTPVEFQQQLVQRWPNGSAEFATLTDAYVLRRYGDTGFGGEQIQGLKTRWQRLRVLMQEGERARG